MKQQRIILDNQQFNCIADQIRARDPARSAAHSVLVEGKSNQEAMAKTGISPASLSNTLARYRKAAKAIAESFQLKTRVISTDGDVETIVYEA